MMAAAIDNTSEVCAICNGSGWEILDGRARECDCARTRRIESILAASRIPERFHASSFANYQALGPSLMKALAASKQFVEQAPLTEVGLLYQGTCGLGKTHLSAAVLTELIRKGLRGFFYDFRDLLKEIQNSYNPTTHTSELKILAPIFDADVLVLDELGAAKPTEWVQETMTYIITERYNRKKLTVFTTNYLDESVQVRDETLTERVGARLRSRLQEMCRLIVMEGRDYRAKIRLDRERR
jgi:DNA replication protein DnaC